VLSLRSFLTQFFLSFIFTALGTLIYRYKEHARSTRRHQRKAKTSFPPSLFAFLGFEAHKQWRSSPATTLLAFWVPRIFLSDRYFAVLVSCTSSHTSTSCFDPILAKELDVQLLTCLPASLVKRTTTSSASYITQDQEHNHLVGR